MIIKDYPIQLGIGCKTAALRNLLEYYGFIFSESMVFGLSNGLSFAYSRPDESYEESEFIAITGTQHFDYYDFAHNLCIDYKSYFPSNNESTWDLVFNFIKQDTPVLLRASLSEYLPFLKSSKIKQTISSQDNFINDSENIFSQFNIPYGSHITQIIGWDDVEKVVYLVENNLSGVQKVPLDIMSQARNPSKKCLNHPNNEIIIIQPTKKIIDLKVVIKNSIINNVNSMLFSSYPRCGLKAVKRLAIEFKDWPNILSKDQIVKSLLMMHYTSEVISGGGFYRRIYSRFLGEASNILENQQLLYCSRLYMDISKRWRIIAKELIKHLPDPLKATQDQRIGELLKEIAQLEEDALMKLMDCIIE